MGRLHGTEYWRRRAKLQLKLEPLCRMCLAAGKIVPATCADHIEPHYGDANKFILGPLQSLCTACHSDRASNGGALTRLSASMAGPSIRAIQPIGNPGVEAGEARPMDSFPWVRKPGARGASEKFKVRQCPTSGAAGQR